MVTTATTAVVNLGLSTKQAKGMQAMLIAYDLDSSMVNDGALGPDSSKAMQQMLKWFHGYDGALDGVPGPKTIVALQRWLKEDRGLHRPARRHRGGRNAGGLRPRGQLLLPDVLLIAPALGADPLRPQGRCRS
ncbi:hypothetical protein [Streptomyces sp. 4N124]|uniref:hypothetical protein n=1 Tax=Streptomyces sp. 4N124 TaxID=3457420 RepID=UPI003FD4163C